MANMRAILIKHTFLLPTGSAQITCYTTPSSDVICAGNSFVAATIDECCMDPNGYFFDGGGTASCTPCIGM